MKNDSLAREGRATGFEAPKLTRTASLWRWVEFFALFIGLPTFFALRLVDIHPIPALWGLALFCLVVLRKDKRFDMRRLESVHGLAQQLRPMLTRFLVIAIGLGIFVALFRPDQLFDFPRRAPGFWVLVMVLYPVFSVLPQSIIQRAYFFQRYTPLFGSGLCLVLVNALTFSYMHIYFLNPVALLITLVGGFLFARTYLKTGSLLVSGLEHALYGDLVFTIGLGQYIYHGAV